MKKRAGPANALTTMVLVCIIVFSTLVLWTDLQVASSVIDSNTRLIRRQEAFDQSLEDAGEDMLALGTSNHEVIVEAPQSLTFSVSDSVFMNTVEDTKDEVSDKNEATEVEDDEDDLDVEESQRVAWRPRFQGNIKLPAGVNKHLYPNQKFYQLPQQKMNGVFPRPPSAPGRRSRPPLPSNSILTSVRAMAEVPLNQYETLLSKSIYPTSVRARTEVQGHLRPRQDGGGLKRFCRKVSLVGY